MKSFNLLPKTYHVKSSKIKVRFGSVPESIGTNETVRFAVSDLPNQDLGIAQKTTLPFPPMGY